MSVPFASRIVLFLSLLLPFMVLTPQKANAQAECGKDTNFTPFQETGYPNIQARCRCANSGTAYDHWVFQFRNSGDNTVNAYYYLQAGNSPNPQPNAFHLMGHGVSELYLTANPINGCVFGLELFITVNDSAQPPPPQKPKKNTNASDGTGTARKAS